MFSPSHNDELKSPERGTPGANMPMSIQDDAPQCQLALNARLF